MIKAYWWGEGSGPGNFGDQLTPVLCELLSGQPVIHAPPHLADVIAVGSVLEPWFWQRDSWRTFQGSIWGAGRMLGKGPMEFAQARVLAVRGRLSLERIECPNKDTVLLGDPALLCPLLANRAVRKYKLGVIPHWSERGLPLVTRFVSTSPEIALIDICDPFEEVLDRMSRCAYILSSALHGLVAADALEIPNEWLWLNTGTEEREGKPEFKYRDYYSVYGMADKEFVTLDQSDTLESVLGRFGSYERPGLTKLQRDLTESFPFARS